MRIASTHVYRWSRDTSLIYISLQIWSLVFDIKSGK
jgi:hypothetical protein